MDDSTEPVSAVSVRLDAIEELHGIIGYALFDCTCSCHVCRYIDQSGFDVSQEHYTTVVYKISLRLLSELNGCYQRLSCPHATLK